MTDTSNMTPGEFEVFRFKDRYISILEIIGISASYDEALMQIISKFNQISRQSWFVHTYTPTITNQSVFSQSIGTVATNTHLLPNTGFTFDIPYPTNVSFRDRP